MIKIKTICLYCGYERDYQFFKCGKCGETKAIKQKKYAVIDYYKTEKEDDETSLDFFETVRYNHNHED